MRRFIDALHDIWCSVTKRCRVEADDDPYIEWMRDQEKAAIDETQKIRQRRMNMIERAYLGEGRSRD